MFQLLANGTPASILCRRVFFADAEHTQSSSSVFGCYTNWLWLVRSLLTEALSPEAVPGDFLLDMQLSRRKKKMTLRYEQH